MCERCLLAKQKMNNAKTQTSTLSKEVDVLQTKVVRLIEDLDAE